MSLRYIIKGLYVVTSNVQDIIIFDVTQAKTGMDAILLDY